MSTKHIITIYTDGACRGNPGPGGWGVVMMWRDKLKELSGFEEHTTNNRMELMAVIEALKSIKRGKSIHLYTDSQYVQKGISIWIKKWKVNNWNNGKVKNRDLWVQLLELDSKHNITWRWVKGHSGNKHNDRADALACEMIDLNALK